MKRRDRSQAREDRKKKKDAWKRKMHVKTRGPPLGSYEFAVEEDLSWMICTDKKTVRINGIPAHHFESGNP